MLKRLELVGFKSFADKTTFEFGDGITGIVGPNGSGKSNIVDAVRWIMGEQSAKSLRGGEMADVIFNGSASRRSLGLAEVTMTFDNRQHQLATPADEVQITRRVYRDSEGEYLVNGQNCRLRDIKELFLGSGAGHDAYCIIEQGKVDVLLQASIKDRRTIFEEAAGISRFKAKKIETLRKLERVEQNVQRLRDIIDEVEKQLRSVKLQAAKAQRYQEYSQRLKELRIGLGLREYRELTDKLTAEQTVIEQLRGDLDQRAARAGACEAESGRLEMLLADLDDVLRDHEARLAGVRQEIKTDETTLLHESALTEDLEAELTRTRGRLAELTSRLGTLAHANQQAEVELGTVEALATSQRLEATTHEENLQATVTRLDELNRQVSADKNQHLEQMRRAAHLQNEAVSSKAHVDNLHRERQRLRHRFDQTAENLAAIDGELRDLTVADDNLQARLGAARQALEDKRHQRDALRQARDQTVDAISELRQQRSGLHSRIEILEGLIRSHEGLGTGVREVFTLIEQAEPGPWGTVLGMIADFLTVRHEYAYLIDLALGDWAQRFLVRDLNVLMDALAARAQPLSGRVSFLQIVSGPPEQPDDALAALRADPLIEVSLVSRLREPAGDAPASDSAERVHRRPPADAWDGSPEPSNSSDGSGEPSHGTNASTPDRALLAPAVQLVSCEHPELADLPSQLLGTTLIVRDLTTARQLAEHAKGFRFITLAGELLEPDGTVTVGANSGATGILSRKSELLDLRERLGELERRITGAEQELTGLRERIEHTDGELRDEQKALEVLTEQGADLHARVERQRDKRQGLHEEVTLNRDETQRLEQEIATLEQSWQDALAQAVAAEEQVHVLHARLADAEEEIRRRERERQEQQLACTQAQVALAKTDERLAALRYQYEGQRRDLDQRRREHDESRHGLVNCRARLLDSQQTMLNASAHLAQAYLDKEAAHSAVNTLALQREQKRQDRGRLAQQAQTLRSEWRAQQELFHARELEANNLTHQRDTLVSRIREDYALDLAELLSSATAEEPVPPPPLTKGGPGGGLPLTPRTPLPRPSPLTPRPSSLPRPSCRTKSTICAASSAAWAASTSTRFKN